MKKPSNHRPRWILVTGLSGAGKTTALKVLEDQGYFTIDNLPLALLPSLILSLRKSKRHFPKVVLGMDAREKNFLKFHKEVLTTLRESGIRPEILFFESRPEVLIRRYSESRRPHPLGKRSSLSRAIAKEKQRLAPLRELATKVFDTSALHIHGLKQALLRYLREAEPEPRFSVQLLSFGYKHGLPAEADLVFDARFLQNPYFVPRLKRLDGRSRPVQKFVLGQKSTQIFLRHVKSLLKFLLPLYQQEGKSQLTVAFGCTGGRHRSVAIVERIEKELKGRRWEIQSIHRDLSLS